MATSASIDDLPLGSLAPDFSLPDTRTGELVSLSDFADAPALLVMILCNHCPYVKHIADHLAGFVRDRSHRGLAAVAISANDVSTYPADSPELMRAEAETRGYVFPYLFDETQAVAKAYAARCTPDFYLFDRARALVYHGRYDASRPSTPTPLTGEELAAAVDAVLAGDAPPSEQKSSIGCSVKWKPGNHPE